MAAASARSKVLVLNAGSSSLKFQVFSLGRAPAAVQGVSGPGGASAAASGGGLQAVAAGLCERIGDPAGDASMQASGGCRVDGPAAAKRE